MCLIYLRWSIMYVYKFPTSSDLWPPGTALTVNYSYRIAKVSHISSARSYYRVFPIPWLNNLFFKHSFNKAPREITENKVLLMWLLAWTSSFFRLLSGLRPAFAICWSSLMTQYMYNSSVLCYHFALECVIFSCQ